MWPMIAESGLKCTECRHHIQPGRLSISELPEEMPVGVSRSDFKNFCLGCPDCWAEGRHACYLRYLARDRYLKKTPRNLPCARCGLRMEAGDSACVEVYYEWPETSGGSVSDAPGGTADSVGGRTCASSLLNAAAAVGIDTLIRGVPSSSFYRLDDSGARLIGKFRAAGRKDWSEHRSLPEAEAFYHDSVPDSVRNLGADAVAEFLEGKHASHLLSRRNNPELASRDTNLIWEEGQANNSRLANDMTGEELFRVRQTNAFDAASIVFRRCLDAAATSALYAGLLEAPIAAIENVIYHANGRKSGEAALADAAKSIVMAAAGGAVIGFAVTGAVALGAGPLLVTIAPVLQTVGLALYGYSALKRGLRALDEGLPLNQVGTYFCSPRCHDRFAYETGCSALMRWEGNRMSSRVAG